ncbi:MAG: ComEC/Rec2 family competence protein [Myxococcales bacterium]|nr:MAG: ComEC/Rec2 family competence protein [Myxococcales bacterium]
MPFVVAVGIAWLSSLFLREAFASSTALKIIVGVFVLAIIALLQRRNNLREGCRVLSQLLMLSLCCGILLQLPRARGKTVPQSGPYVLRIRVEKTDHTRGGPRSLVSVLSGKHLINKTAMEPGTKLYVYPREFPLGAELSVFLKIKSFSRFDNPSPHPTWSFGEAERPSASAWIIAPETIQTVSRNLFLEKIQTLRSRIRSRLQQTLGRRTAALGCAWVLGESALMDPDDKAAFRKAGMAHLLAVSGLHVSLIAGIFLLVIRRLLQSTPLLSKRFDIKPLAYVTALPFVVFVALVANGSPSAWRAALTAILSWSATAFSRQPCTIRTVAASLVLFCVFDPVRSLQPAFLLSIMATASLIGSAARFSFLKTHWTTAYRSFIATAPLLWWCFSSLPLVGLLSNVILLPLLSVTLLPLCFIHTFLATLGLGVAEYSAFVLSRGSEWMHSANAWLAQISFGQVLPPPSLLQGLIAAPFSLFFLASERKQKRSIVAALALLALFLAEAHLRYTEKPTGALRVSFLDVGQGDAALIDLPNGKLMMIDTGGDPLGKWDPGAKAVLPLLKARRRERIDILAISHPHPDHYAGLAALLEEIKITEIWDSGQALQENPEGGYAKLLALAQKREHACLQHRPFATMIYRRAAPRFMSFGPALVSMRAMTSTTTR